MSLESALQSLLSGVGASAYPDFAPPDASRPYITWQQIGGASTNYIDNTVPDGVTVRMQINCWADTRLAVNALARQVEAALITATAIQARPLGEFSATFDEDLALRGTLQDFAIAASR